MKAWIFPANTKTVVSLYSRFHRKTGFTNSHLDEVKLQKTLRISAPCQTRNRQKRRLFQWIRPCNKTGFNVLKVRIINRQGHVLTHKKVASVYCIQMVAKLSIYTIIRIKRGVLFDPITGTFQCPYSSEFVEVKC